MKIKTFDSTQPYSYLWLKYVTGFNLNVHCARCLLGEYSEHFPKGGASETHLKDIELNEHPFEFIYICGVTANYVWKKNLHLVVREKKGSIVDYTWDKKTHIVIEDAERIEIKALDDYSKEQKGSLSSYHTCRNWRFAYQIKYGIK